MSLRVLNLRLCSRRKAKGSLEVTIVSCVPRAVRFARPAVCHARVSELILGGRSNWIRHLEKTTRKRARQSRFMVACVLNLRDRSSPSGA